MTGILLGQFRLPNRKTAFHRELLRKFEDDQDEDNQGQEVSECDPRFGNESGICSLEDNQDEDNQDEDNQDEDNQDEDNQDEDNQDEDNQDEDNQDEDNQDEDNQDEDDQDEDNQDEDNQGQQGYSLIKAKDFYLVPSNLLLEPQGSRLGERKLEKGRLYSGDFEITKIPDYLPPLLQGNSPPATLDLRFTKIRKIGEEFTMAFNETEKGGNILLPPGVEIEEDAFRGAKIQSINLDNARLCAGSFSFAILKTIDLSRSDLKVIPEGCFASSTVEEILLPSTLKKIDDGAFAETHLKALVLPEGLETIRVGAFAESTLQEITIPASITKIFDGAFSRCQELQTIDLSQSKIRIIPRECFFAANMHSQSSPECRNNRKVCFCRVLAARNNNSRVCH